MGEILKDRTETAIKKIGANVREQRKRVFREDEADFAERVSLATNIAINESDILSIENDGELSFRKAAAIFAFLQFIDRIVDASKNETSLYLSSIKHVSGIEDEIRGNSIKQEKA